MGDAETFAGDAFEVVTGQLVSRRKGHRMHKDIQPVPVLAQFREQVLDLLVTADIAGQHDVRVAFAGHFRDTRAPSFSFG